MYSYALTSLTQSWNIFWGQNSFNSRKKKKKKKRTKGNQSTAHQSLLVLDYSIAWLWCRSSPMKILRIYPVQAIRLRVSLLKYLGLYRIVMLKLKYNNWWLNGWLFDWFVFFIRIEIYCILNFICNKRDQSKKNKKEFKKIVKHNENAIHLQIPMKHCKLFLHHVRVSISFSSQEFQRSFNFTI